MHQPQVDLASIFLTATALVLFFLMVLTFIAFLREIKTVQHPDEL
jgi:hypothetical protein